MYTSAVFCAVDEDILCINGEYRAEAHAEPLCPNLSLIKLRRRIRETDYAADADVLLMREAARENDAHETLTEVRGRTSNREQSHAQP